MNAMSETLTGKEALLAVLEGTHWWETETEDLVLQMAVRDEKLSIIVRKWDRKNEMWDTLHFENHWTRGED